MPSPSPAPKQDNILLGICYACLAALMLSTMNLLAKMMGSWFGPIEISFYRNVVALAILVMGILFFRKINLLKTKRPFAQFIRSAIGTTGMVFVMWAVLILPLSTTIVLGFTAPLFVGLLSYPLLKEKVSAVRLVVIFIGFSGILLIAQPDNDIELYAILIGLTAGFLNGLVAICLRWLGSTEHTVTTNFYFLFYGLIGTALFMPFISETLPSTDSYNLIFAIGVIGLLSLLFKTQGFRHAPAAVISPFSYTMIIWAILFDYLFWDSLPTLYTIIGSAIIIGSNLFLIFWENRKTST